MIDADKPRLKAALDTAYEFFGKTMTPGMAKVWLDQLQPYDINDIENAFRAYHAVMQRPPLPNDILRYLPDVLGHPLPEEAWNFAPKRETDGGYITQQMATALGAAQSSVEQGNLIAARVAFIECYKREVDEARSRKIPARFFYSPPCGLTRENFLSAREGHILFAANKKWIETTKALRLLNDICAEQGKSLTPYLKQLGATKESVPMIPNLNAASNGTGRVTDGLKSIVQASRVHPDSSASRPESAAASATEN